MTSGLALAAAAAVAERADGWRSRRRRRRRQGADRRRLRARRAVHDLQHDAAGAAVGRPAGVPARRAVLVSHHHRERAARRSWSIRSRPRRSACDLPACAAAGGGGRGGRGRPAPAGVGARRGATCRRPTASSSVFIRDWNLWVRDAATGKETALTTDGVKDFGYATDNAGWARSDRPIVVWSPDSKHVATFQQDQRNVGEMYLVSTQGRPSGAAGLEVSAARRSGRLDDPAGGDRRRAGEGRALQDGPGSAPLHALRQPVVPRRRLGRRAVGAGLRRAVAFVSTSRDHKKTTLRVADPATGAVRDVLEETVPTFYESGNGRINWRYLPASNEVIWFSERDNWGQLYLYDLQTGKLKHQITSGEGNITQLVRVDEKRRLLFVQAVGREKGRDPYFTHFYKVNMDGGIPALLTPEDATHEVTLAENGDYFVDSYSAPDRAADRGRPRPQRQADSEPGEGRHHPADRDRLAAADADHGEGARRPDRSLRPDVQAVDARSEPQVPDRQPDLSGPADRQRRQPRRSRRPAATRRRSPSSASSWCRSTGWGRRGARRSSTRRTSATWATTRCPTRSPG